MTLRPHVPISDLDADSGHSVLEVTVSVLLATFVFAGAMLMLSGFQRLDRNVDNQVTTLQSARMAIDQLQRDMLSAGVGLAPTTPLFPLVVPLDNGGVELRRNLDAVSAYVIDAGGDRVSLSTVEGFAEHMTVAIYDTTGDLEFSDVDTIERHSNGLKLARSMTKAFRRRDGAAVARVQRIRYWLETEGGEGTLFRRIDDEPAQPVATGVRALRFRYFDSSAPQKEIVPTTPERQAMIRTIEAEIEVESERERLDRGSAQTVTLRARVTPRSLLAGTGLS